MSPRSRVTALLMAAALPVLVLGCGGESNGGASTPLPDPVQLDPPPGADRLAPQEVDRAVESARADRTTAAGIRQGPVARVLVRAEPSGSRAATVAFLFRSPRAPKDDPYDVLCDIAGQTPEWQGIAARVSLHDDEVESSPVWLTGANCVGMPLPAASR